MEPQNKDSSSSEDSSRISPESVGAMAEGSQPMEEETRLRDTREEGSNLTAPLAKGGQIEGAAAAQPLPPPYTEIDLSAIQSQPMVPPPSYVAHPPHHTAYPIDHNLVSPEPAQPATFVLLRDLPVQMRCPRCNVFGWTTTHATNGGFSWLLAALFCLFGFYFCCCIIPLLVSAFKDTQHHCSNCKTYIGTYRRL